MFCFTVEQLHCYFLKEHQCENKGCSSISYNNYYPMLEKMPSSNNPEKLKMERIILLAIQQIDKLNQSVTYI